MRGLNNLYFSSDIKVIEARRMRWEGHVTCMWQMRDS